MDTYTRLGVWLAHCLNECDFSFRFLNLLMNVQEHIACHLMAGMNVLLMVEVLPHQINPLYLQCMQMLHLQLHSSKKTILTWSCRDQEKELRNKIMIVNYYECHLYYYVFCNNKLLGQSCRLCSRPITLPASHPAALPCSFLGSYS